MATVNGQVNGKRQKVEGQESKVKGNGKAKVVSSPYSRLPYDGRLLVRFLEILCSDDVKYTSGGKFTSRIHKAVMYALYASSDNIKFSGFAGVWYVKSSSRPGLNRWYIVDTESLTCEVDISQLVIPPGVRIDESALYCEDHRHGGGLCWHLFAAALAEAARVDYKEFGADVCYAGKEEPEHD